MRMSRYSLSLAAVVVLAIASGQLWAQGQTSAGAPYRNVSPAELREMLSTKDFYLVNVHVPYEGEIPGTDAFIPFDLTRSQIKEYPSDKNAKIVLYCRSGRMSDIAARQLATAGYTNLYNLAGGMIAWEDAGLPLAMDPARKQE